MQDAWRAYLELALGLTEASRKKATNVARQLLGKGGATAEQLQALAEDLVRTSTANREAITKLVRYELDRALGVVGLASSEEVGALSARVVELEQRLREAEARAAQTGTPGAAGPPAEAMARRAVTTQAMAKKAVAKKAVAKKAVAKKAVAKKAAAKNSGTRRTTARKSAGGAA